MDCRLVYVSEMEEMFNIRDGVTTIGREVDNDIQLLKANVSRHHARMTNLPNVCQVEDLRSANGTFVNGDKITAISLRHNDEIRFGDEVFRFETIGSVGSDEATVRSRDYSDKTQKETVKIQQCAPETKIMQPVINFAPLRPKKK
ncbi:MAG: FHA domain-containing protein [Kiritimatiellae bacterium]|nr:FHA domain-containing protein [Kiritimatiellia bacterium]